MELLDGIAKVNRLKQDMKDIEEWLLEVEHGENKTKPVRGPSWYKLKNAINVVIDGLHEEAEILEVKIKKVADGLKID